MICFLFAHIEELEFYWSKPQRTWPGGRLILNRLRILPQELSMNPCDSLVINILRFLRYPEISILVAVDSIGLNSKVTIKRPSRCRQFCCALTAPILFSHEPNQVADEHRGSPMSRAVWFLTTGHSVSFSLFESHVSSHAQTWTPTHRGTHVQWHPYAQWQAWNARPFLP